MIKNVSWSDRSDWFTYIMWWDWKQKSIYAKNCCKQQFSKEALFWYNLNPKGIIMFPYDDKQFILLTSMGNNNP